MKSIWTGRILSTIAVLFLAFDVVIKFTDTAALRDSFTQLGYPLKLAVVIGIIELVCVVVYLIPRTSLFGAILLTGYLGGAITTHLRVENPLFSHILFPTYVAALIWGGLLLRNPRMRALFLSQGKTATA